MTPSPYRRAICCDAIYGEGNFTDGMEKSQRRTPDSLTIRFHVASLYPMLYRLEQRGWLQGRWVEKSGQRRRRYYRVTRRGRRVLASQLRGWRQFVAGINRITEAENA